MQLIISLASFFILSRSIAC
uniref:Uncharacterized protein n=1 Tax=Arundo donax TaxID=35708 RepID=A0A0A8YIE7_ARUDO